MLASVVITTVIASCRSTEPTGPPLPHLSPSHLTGNAARALGRDGRFSLAPSAPEGYAQLTRVQAEELAQAWVRDFAAMRAPDLGRMRGAPIDAAALFQCGHTAYAAGIYEPLPPGLPDEMQNFVAAHYLVSFCQAGTPALSLAVSSAATRLHVDGGHIVFPAVHGNEFRPSGIPAVLGDIPVSPEAAAALAATVTRRRVSEVPELVMPDAFDAPQLARWRITLEAPVHVRGDSTRRDDSTQEVFVGLVRGRTGYQVARAVARGGDSTAASGQRLPFGPQSGRSPNEAVPLILKRGLARSYEGLTVVEP